MLIVHGIFLDTEQFVLFGVRISTQFVIQVLCSEILNGVIVSSLLQYTYATIIAIKFYNLHVELPSLSANVLSTSLNDRTSVFSLMFVSMHVDPYIH